MAPGSVSATLSASDAPTADCYLERYLIGFLKENEPSHYQPTYVWIGGRTRTRTLDPLIKSQSLAVSTAFGRVLGDSINI